MGWTRTSRKHAVDFNLEGTYKLFNREHEATLGYSYIRNHQQDKQSTGTINDSNVIKSTTTDWTSWTPQSITWSDFTEAANYKQNINSIYAATRLHLNEDLKLYLVQTMFKLRVKAKVIAHQ